MRSPIAGQPPFPWRWGLALGTACCLLAGVAGGRAAEPLRLHPNNPHYFLFRDKPTILITSGEHYGAVLNLDFDYVRYLDELKTRGFNLTRIFAGTYREIPGSFNITDNTLAPRRGRFVCPWARSTTPGAGDGGNKFDLTKWDPAYFRRLKDFATQAGKRGIVVELGLFCTIYDDKLWAVNPMNTANNINGIGHVKRLEVYARKEAQLTSVQEALARKIATELKDVDNIYFEVCNEPYFGGVTRAWTDRLIAAIVKAEQGQGRRHLLAQNIANGSAKVDRPNPAVSIFNFHYAAPPTTVADNYGLRRVIADDETGFRKTADLPYRTEGWDFLLAGGAVYSNLDYSFTCAHPDGTARVTTSPGGGGPSLRRQLQVLKEFMDGFAFVRMAPHNEVIQSKTIAASASDKTAAAAATVRVLAEIGAAYAVYVRGGVRAKLVIHFPPGTYRAEWVNPRTGKVDHSETFKQPRGNKKLVSPEYAEDIALRIRRVNLK